MNYTTDGVSMGVGIIAALFCVVMFFVTKSTVLLIEYAGGYIAFSLKLIEKHEHENFVRHIQMIKDNIYSSAAVEQGFKNNKSE